MYREGLSIRLALPLDHRGAQKSRMVPVRFIDELPVERALATDILRHVDLLLGDFETVD